MSEIKEEIINKVAGSGLITIDLEEFYPAAEIVELDIKDYLYEGIILREKDFREKLLATNWNDYSNKILAVYCSEDAIIPMWAYMLITTHAAPYVKHTGFGRKEEVAESILLRHLYAGINPADYEGKRVVIKGCGDKKISENIYIQVTEILHPFVKSLMYGEPCSTVPIYKKK